MDEEVPRGVLMAILIVLTTIFLALTTIVIPVQRARAIEARRLYDEAYKGVKLRAIRRYYPLVRELSDHELTSKFDIERAYQDIGRR